MRIRLKAYLNGNSTPFSYLFLLLFLVTLLSFPGVSVASGDSPGISPDEALKLLKDGNARYSSGKSIHPRMDSSRRNDTSTNGQHPFATILGCSDSRVPIEVIFDQGIGDIFPIRVAGNVCDVDEIGSIEYGVDHLGTPVMVVLGHTQCGAVTAVVTDAELHGSIPPLVDNIKPAAAAAKLKNPGVEGNDLVPMAVEANVFQSIEDLLKKSPATRQKVKDGKLQVIGAVYNLSTGGIKWLGTHPEQSALLSTVAAGGHTSTSSESSTSHSSKGSSTASDSSHAGSSSQTASNSSNHSSAGNESAANIKDTYTKKAQALGLGRYIFIFFGVLIFILSLVMTLYYARVQDSRGNTSFKLTLSAKIAGAMSLLLVAFTCLIVYTLQTMSGIGANLDELAVDTIPLAEHTSSIEAHFLQQSTVLERVFRYGEETDAKAEFDKEIKVFESSASDIEKEIEDTIKLLEELPAHNEEQANLMSDRMNKLAWIAKASSESDTIALEIFTELRNGNTDKAHQLEKDLQTREEKVDEELSTLLLEIEKESGEVSKRAVDHGIASNRIVSILAAIICIIGFGFAVIQVRSIMSPITRILTDLKNGANEVSAAASQVSNASQVLAQASSEQASALEETSSSVEEMASMTRQNAENATEANTLVQKAKVASQKGNEATQNMIVAINSLKDSSNETQKIVKTIDEIAFQTNLLALNAAVEAARAGEAGKGFAVVAEEVRNLAQRSSESARITNDLIAESVSRTQNGVSIAENTAKSLEEIISGVIKISDLVSEITSASGEQTSGIDQINTAIGQMESITQSNAATSEESASAAEELASQAESMHRVVMDLSQLVFGLQTESDEGRMNSHHHDQGHMRHNIAEFSPQMNRRQGLKSAGQHDSISAGKHPANFHAWNDVSEDD
jgi:carbonic anhydrase